MITLFPTYILGDLRLTSYPYAVEFGGDHGAPETVTELVQSLLADGDIVRVSRHGNREISLVVHVEGASLAEVAENEAALRRECAKLRNLLTFEPGDPLGSPASVFEVHVAEMRHPRDDEMEQHLLRRWELTLTCAPHAGSANLTTVSALVAGSTTTLVDNCDSATGWTATRNGAADVATTFWEAGSVGVAELDAFVGNAPETWALTRTGSVDFSATPYLVVEARVLGTRDLSVAGLSASAGPGRNFPALSVRKVDDLYSEVIFDTTGFVGAASSLTFTITTDDPNQAWQGLLIRNVSRSDVPPSQTSRQVSRIINVGGTERTPASIRVASANGTDNLGLTIVHTSPEDGSGYSPPLRRWRTAGNTVTADTATVSGGRELLHPNPVQFEVPTSSLPEGGYLVCAFLRVGVAGDHSIYFSSYTRMPAPNESSLLGEVINRRIVNFPVANTWQFVPLGFMTLPTVRTKAGKALLGIQRDTASLDDILIDEAWLFRVDDDCAMSFGNIPAPNLWLDSPSTKSPVPTVWMGEARESSANPGGDFIAGAHVLHPDDTSIFAATLGTPWPQVSAEFRRQWHSNAAD